MRIAQVAPLFEAVPPLLYGGSERVVSHLTEALVVLGHEVTLLASGDSTTKADLQAPWPTAIRLDPTIRDFLAPQIMQLEMLASRALEFDIIHLHNDFLALPLLKRLGVPFLITLHGRVDLPETQKLLKIFDDVPLVSISGSQRKYYPEANYIKTIHHGVPSDFLPLGNGSGGYLAFLGRISPEKGPDAAIRIAQRAGKKLVIAAKVDPFDREYFEKEIKHLLDLPHVEYIGEINDEQKSAFLGNATALLFPIAWPEPFGLAMIEAMMCGTPSIAMGLGAVPEVVEEGLTGFVVDNEDEAVAAVGRIGDLDRGKVRERGLQRFSSGRMAQDYVALYGELSASR